jgi:hypothetical protein
MASITEFIPEIVKALGQAAAFEAGSAITIPVAPASYTLDLTAEGIGKVAITESGTTVSIKKA